MTHSSQRLSRSLSVHSKDNKAVKLSATEAAELGIYWGGTNMLACLCFRMPAMGRIGPLLFFWW